jgi:cyclic pyranopterin phosphate synthase
MEIDVLGGEPFIQPDTFRLINEVTNVNPNCEWGFVTNGHYRFSGKIRASLDRIKIRYIHVSIDSLNPDTYKAIRVNGDLSKPLDTLECLITYNEERSREGRSFDIGVSICVQKKNWREVGEFIHFARQRGVEPITQFAYESQEISLLGLPLSEQQEVIRYFQSLAADNDEVITPLLNPFLRFKRGGWQKARNEVE